MAAGATDVPKDLRQSLIYESGADSYPIVNFEYLVLHKAQSSLPTALAMRTFLTWAISSTGGATAANLTKENFVALPTSVIPNVTFDPLHLRALTTP